jgi:phosphopantothenoylcysteine decarboxylase/phosphopantothenate--cysteine ligase
MGELLADKQVVLGVSGGIAAYKSIELVRLFMDKGARIRVMMTRYAQEFVGPLTFEALTGKPVCTSLFGREGGDASIRHIEWAEQADLVVIAPATANMIGKLAGGIADDALSTFMLAVTAPKIVCPSMNTNMFLSPVVQRNLNRLREDGYWVIDPDSGPLACGTVGPGRLPSPAVIVDRAGKHLAPKDYAGKNILVTAGPTWEPIDPVRYISNPSSGKMGYAIAKAAEYRGGHVTLIAGPNQLENPLGVKVIHVVSAQEMAGAVFQNMQPADVIIKTAAVSDYRPKQTARQKIKKEKEELILHLEKNQDILKKLGEIKKGHQILVGFAAETQQLERNAHQKLTQKNLDMIVGNLIGAPDSGFAVSTNKVTIFYRSGAKESLPVMTKEALAHVLLDKINAYPKPKIAD